MNKFLRATTCDLVVALLIFIIISASIYLFLGRQINEAISLVNRFAMKTENSSNDIILEIDGVTRKLVKHPKYGANYATLSIPSIDVNLPVFYGDSLEILKNGVGHSTGSYFPGENSSIIYMGHNYAGYFRRFSELQIGDKITVTTDYGTFNYIIYDMQIILETELNKLPIQKEEEILMIYTCYPFNNIGYTTKRYVVYSKPET